MEQRSRVGPRSKPTLDPEPVEVRVYKFTGWQGLFKIPESWCRECDMFVRAADRAAEDAKVPVDVRVLAWFPRILGTLRWGIKNPPLMVVDGELIASGYDVPEPERIVEAVHEASNEPLDGVSR